MIIKITLTYDGTDFCGWQVQPNLPSIQGELETAIKKLCGEEVSVIGSGRTDAGAHALGQVASFELKKPFDIARIVPGLNYYLPPTIRVINAEKESDDFNARFSAKSKTYLYLLYNAEIENPLLRHRALRVNGLDFEKIKSAAKLFEGTHDFSAFMSSGSEVKTTVRTVYKCDFYFKDGFYVLEISANGFLYNMVRKIIAFLISIGMGKKEPNLIIELLKNGGKTKEIAPSYGLYLKSVEY